MASRLKINTDWDRMPGPEEFTLLPSAARTETTPTPDQTNTGWRGFYFFLDITAVPGGDTIAPHFQVKDAVSGQYFTVYEGSSYSSVSLSCGVYYGSVSDAGSPLLDERVSVPLPRTWRIRMVHSGAGSFTYSLAVCMLP